MVAQPERFAAAAVLLSSCLLAQHAEQPSLWSFRPLAEASPPVVAEPEWNGTPIDRFVRHAQIAAGVTPVAVADRRTLLRRVHFALTGLPPTPAEIDAFLADPDPDALATVVDRLLASPHFGERQARHWLDLARYSDSNGLDENLAFAQAFRFRDWVVRASNDDLPFDRFGTLQIAGDLLPTDDPAPLADRLVATGFLALGPKMLAEQDKDKLLFDTVDEQLDLVGRTFLGLTIGCARCHDHKFDPISQRDYFALAGIFKSTDTFANLDHVSRWVDRELATDAEIAERKRRQGLADAAAATLEQTEREAMQELRHAAVADVGRYLLAAQVALTDARFVEAEAAARTNLNIDRDHWGSPQCVVLHTHQGGTQFAEYELDIVQGGRHRLEVRMASKESRPLQLQIDGKVVADRVLEQTTGDWFPAHQRWFVAAELELVPGRHTLRLQGLQASIPHLDKLLLVPLGDGTTRPWPADSPLADGLIAPIIRQVADALLSRADAPLLEPWQRLAGGDDATFAERASAQQGKGGPFAVLLGGLPPQSRRELAARYQTLFATAADAWQRALATAEKDKAPKQLADALLEGARALLFEPGGLLAVQDEALRPALPAATQARLHELTSARDAALAAVPPKAPVAMCVRDGKPVDLPVHIRGNHLALAATPTPRGYLSGLAATVPGPAIPPNGSGRRELAQWLFDPRNPLTARVQVNRIWQRLFGHGLVRSASNFGVRGDRPSHPDLLDWLARELIADGWSQKRLFRRILLTRTWQLAATPDQAAAALDPENRLLWRHDRVRLEAEIVRDAMLAVAGTLDRTVGGSLLTIKDRDYVTNDQSGNGAQYTAPRRSLYLPVIRNAMFDFFTAFDYCDPSVHLEQRPASAVAPQALLLLNSPFANEQARAFAGAAAAVAGDGARIDWIWRQALGRTPSPTERAAIDTWLQQSRAAGTAEPWPQLCQVAMASNEFLYID